MTCLKVDGLENRWFFKNVGATTMSLFPVAHVICKILLFYKSMKR